MVSSDITRRECLFAVASTGIITGLAGCVQSEPTANEEGVQRRVSIAEQDSTPDSSDLEIEVSVTKETITNSETAYLEITTTNQGSARSVSVGADSCRLFEGPDGGSDDPLGLWLYNPNYTDSLDHKKSRWSVDRPASETRNFSLAGCSPTRYGSGDSVSNKYAVWDDYRESGYLEPNTYRWEGEVSIWSSLATEPENDPTQSFNWGFSLLVESAIS